VPVSVVFADRVEDPHPVDDLAGDPADVDVLAAVAELLGPFEDRDPPAAAGHPEGGGETCDAGSRDDDVPCGHAVLFRRSCFTVKLLAQEGFCL
jgi:hypothetical protein